MHDDNVFHGCHGKTRHFKLYIKQTCDIHVYVYFYSTLSNSTVKSTAYKYSRLKKTQKNHELYDENAERMQNRKRKREKQIERSSSNGFMCSCKEL